MNEHELIRMIAGRLPRSRDQLNQVFECDAELVRIGDQVWGLTMDDFSPEEDLFSSGDPAALGANLAVATLSDLLAAGAEAKFFMHAMSFPRDEERAFFEAFIDGIRAVLETAGCAFCGGDLGTAATWRYGGFAMGPIVSARPLTHRMPAEPQTLWVTGELGDANLAALLGRPTPSFQLRLKEAEVIRKHATACIDTSGGFLDAVWVLHAMNPELGISVHADRISLAAGIREAAAMAGIPAETALVGGAGEYELLFATPADVGRAVRSEFQALGITAVADVSVAGTPGVQICRGGAVTGTMRDPPPSGRAAASVTDHVRAATAMAASLFGSGRRT